MAFDKKKYIQNYVKENYKQFNIPTVAGSGLNEEMQLPEPQTSP